MPDVRLDRLLREEQPLADLAVDETIGDELEHLDLARRRLLRQLTQRRRVERDHGAGAARAAPCGRGLEPPAVVAVAAENFFALCSIHAVSIGAGPQPFSA